MIGDRFIAIETRTRIDLYKLKKDTGQMVRVRKGLYRTDNYLMVPSEDKKKEVVPYHLGDTQPRGHGFQVKTKYTMAHIRIAQSNHKKTSIIDGFNMKYLIYGLVAVFIVIGLISGLTK